MYLNVSKCSVPVDFINNNQISIHTLLSTAVTCFLLVFSWIEIHPCLEHEESRKEVGWSQRLILYLLSNLFTVKSPGANLSKSVNFRSQSKSQTLPVSFKFLKTFLNNMGQQSFRLWSVDGASTGSGKVFTQTNPLQSHSQTSLLFRVSHKINLLPNSSRHESKKNSSQRVRARGRVEAKNRSQNQRIKGALTEPGR